MQSFLEKENFHKMFGVNLGVSNQWNGIWIGIVEWNGGMVKY